MCLASRSTAEAIYSKIIEQFEIQWENCVAFSVDNASANLGIRNNLRSRAQQQNPHIYFIGCPCHTILLQKQLMPFMKLQCLM